MILYLVIPILGRKKPIRISEFTQSQRLNAEVDQKEREAWECLLHNRCDDHIRKEYRKGSHAVNRFYRGRTVNK